MSIKCNRCKNKVFDGNAYLKISQMEQFQLEKVNDVKKELKMQRLNMENSQMRQLLK